MKKHITIIGLNYFPEDSAIGLYSTQMAEFLVKKGYDVEVITGFPYYPQWSIYNLYKNKPKKYSEIINGVTVHRYKQYVPKKPTFLNRIFHIIDFTLGNISNLKKIKNTDLIIAIVPFTSALFLGNILKKRTKSKLWVHFQDFEVDAAKESGFSSSNNWLKSLILKFSLKIEKKWINGCDIASSISYAMLDKLKKKTSIETFYFPNWVDLKIINPKESKQHKNFVSTKFNILYSGNIGEKQDWEFFIKYCEALKNINGIQINIVGDGSKKDWLIERIKKFNHVFYFPSVPLNELSDLLCSVQIHILFQKKNVLDAVMPSKILGMMASENPSIVTGNIESETAKIFEKCNGCYFYDSSDLEKAVNKSIDLQNNKELKETGKNASTFIRDNFEKSKILESVAVKIKSLIQG